MCNGSYRNTKTLFSYETNHVNEILNFFENQSNNNDNTPIISITIRTQNRADFEEALLDIEESEDYIFYTDSNELLDDEQPHTRMIRIVMDDNEDEDEDEDLIL